MEVKHHRHGYADVEFTSNVKEIDGLLKYAVAEALEAIGRDAASTAANKAPYDTGTLANSISNYTDREELIEYIGTNVEYAGYQEFGTSKIRGKHYLRFGATAHAAEYADTIADHVKRILGD